MRKFADDLSHKLGGLIAEVIGVGAIDILCNCPVPFVVSQIGSNAAALLQ